MLHPTKNLLLLTAIAISLAACSDGTQTATNTPSSPGASPAASPVSASGEKAAPAASVAIPGVKNISELTLKTPSGTTQSGFFDAVNDTNITKHNVAKTAPLKMAGWAILPDKGKPADRVIITLADNKTVLAVVPVNLPRPDVAKTLKNPAYQTAGWNATVNASTLPAGKSVLKAWAYDSATKEATQLGRTHEITVTE